MLLYGLHACHRGQCGQATLLSLVKNEVLPYLNHCSCQHRLVKRSRSYVLLTSCYVDGMDSGNYDNDRVGAWEAQRRIMSSLGQGVCGGSQNLCRRKQGSYACAGHFEGLQTSYLLIGALTIHEAHLQVSVVLSIESCHAEQALISWAEKETE